MILDRGLRYVWANAAYMRATSSRLEDLVRRHIIDAFPDPDDPDNQNARVLRESFERVITTRETDAIAYIPYPHLPGVSVTAGCWRSASGAPRTRRYLMTRARSRSSCSTRWT